MISKWVQRVAEFKFYLVSYSPVPVLWQPPPEALTQAHGGRTWLLIHRHGHRFYFSERNRDRYQSAVQARFGPPQETFVLRFSEHDSVEVSVFSPGVWEKPVAKGVTRRIKQPEAAALDHGESFGPGKGVRNAP